MQTRPIPARALAATIAWSACCLVLPCTSSGCAGYQEFLEDQTDTAPTAGTIEASGAPAGVWTFPVGHCASGMREGFYGVTLMSEDKQHAVRIVRNPIGPMTVAFRAPGSNEEYVAVPCRAVVGSMRGTGTRINGVAVLSGDVRFSCENLRGAARFTCS
ncbi:MAG: hypothetical protein HY898_27165 [Deltaproteobacteria bacterium]|nr:hypothetical protein [Deltaproteobacteria bacterium]